MRQGLESRLGSERFTFEILNMKWFLTSCIVLFLLIEGLSQNPQDSIEHPVFVGPEKLLENHVLKMFNDRIKSLESECESSFGLIEFYVDENGRPNSITIPPNFSNEITWTINSIINTSKWEPMKVNGNAVNSIAIFLPLIVTIETGCEENQDIKRVFGLGHDIMRMASFRNEKMRNCLLLKPISYSGPIE